MANNKVTINGKDYVVPELNNNAICDLADNGFDILSPAFKKKNPMSIARSLVAWIMGIDLEDAGDVLQEHIENGGELAPIIEAFGNAVSESGFIKALTLRANAKQAGVEPQDHKKKAAQ